MSAGLFIERETYQQSGACRMATGGIAFETVHIRQHRRLPLRHTTRLCLGVNPAANDLLSQVCEKRGIDFFGRWRNLSRLPWFPRNYCGKLDLWPHQGMKPVGKGAWDREEVTSYSTSVVGCTENSLPRFSPPLHAHGIVVAAPPPPRSLYRWHAIFEEFGQVTKPPSVLRGHDRIVSLAVLTVIREVFFHDPTVMLDELAWHLAIHHDVVISTSALQATLVRAGLTSKVLQKVVCKRDEVQREEYWDCIRDPTSFSGTGLEFVAVDESSKDDRTTSRNYGRSPLGQRAESSELFSRRLHLDTDCLGLNVDAYQFFDFIVEDVLPHIKPYPDVQSVLILDNCRIHHTELLREVLNEHGVMTYLRCHGRSISQEEDPFMALLDSTACITAEMAVGWFKHAGYIW
ncbi:hypothetical protein B0H16DRAFT_1857033 [Mycena metata]|uniref:Tc1-like transposase DDE domain-containing protein n=1 Tax=Mycena metata TaxID=1033252 RepID=A0AAD7IK03_9AGAR|nr:hypothetical protein B0H16DRAFT_1857033 [Mycena metata]